MTSLGALVDLGAITDDGDKDDLTGGKGLDELIGGIADKLKASSLPHSNVANLSYYRSCASRLRVGICLRREADSLTRKRDATALHVHRGGTPGTVANNAVSCGGETNLCSF